MGGKNHSVFHSLRKLVLAPLRDRPLLWLELSSPLGLITQVMVAAPLRSWLQADGTDGQGDCSYCSAEMFLVLVPSKSSPFEPIAPATFTQPLHHHRGPSNLTLGQGCGVCAANGTSQPPLFVSQGLWW